MLGEQRERHYVEHELQRLDHLDYKGGDTGGDRVEDRRLASPVRIIAAECGT